MLTINEFNNEVGAGQGTVQFGTTAVTGINLAGIKFHEDTTLTTLYVDGVATDVRASYHLEGVGSTFKQGAFLRPRKDLGHRFFSGVDVSAGSGEGVLTDKKK